MKHELNRFDWIAGQYDWLKRTVFGDAIGRSQRCFLNRLPEKGNLLVVGGGTGEFLAMILARRPALRIWYLDASARMLSIAKARLDSTDAGRVQFIHGTATAIPPDVTFHAVITGFFLDMFPEAEVVKLCRTIGAGMNSGGCWLIADFIDGGKWWQRVLLWTMYRFFNLCCGVAAKKLPAWERCAGESGLLLKERALFYNGFIVSAVFEQVHPECAGRMTRLAESTLVL